MGPLTVLRNGQASSNVTIPVYGDNTDQLAWVTQCLYLNTCGYHWQWSEHLCLVCGHVSGVPMCVPNHGRIWDPVLHTHTWHVICTLLFTMNTLTVCYEYTYSAVNLITEALFTQLTIFIGAYTQCLHKPSVLYCSTA